MKKVIIGIIIAIGLFIVIGIGTEVYSDYQRENEIERLQNSIYETEREIEMLDRYIELCEKSSDCE